MIYTSLFQVKFGRFHYSSQLLHLLLMGPADHTPPLFEAIIGFSWQNFQDPYCSKESISFLYHMISRPFKPPCCKVYSHFYFLSVLNCQNFCSVLYPEFTFALLYFRFYCLDVKNFTVIWRKESRDGRRYFLALLYVWMFVWIKYVYIYVYMYYSDSTGKKCVCGMQKRKENPTQGKEMSSDGKTW